MERDIDFATVSNGKKVKPVTLKDPLDLATVHGLIEQDFDKAIGELEVKESAVEVKDDKSNELIVIVGNKAKKVRQAMEAKRKEIIGPAKEFLDGVNGKVKKFTIRLQDVEASAKRKSGEYQYRLELERRKQEDAIRKANEELQKKLNKEAKKSGIEAPKVEPMPVPKQDKVVRTEDGSTSHIRKEWKGKIIDPCKVPYEYCEPSQRAINQAIRMGVREIPGVEIKEEITTVFR